jgi:predicted acyl esterase
MLGAPAIDVTYATAAPDVEIAVRLWDVDPATGTQALVTRGVYRSLDGPGTGLHARFEIAPNGYRFAAGHTIKIEMTANDAPYYQPSNIPAIVLISTARIELPSR